MGLLALLDDPDAAFECGRSEGSGAAYGNDVAAGTQSSVFSKELGPRRARSFTKEACSNFLRVTLCPSWFLFFGKRFAYVDCGEHCGDS